MSKGGSVAADAAALADIQRYFDQIAAINTRYRNLVDKLTPLKKAKSDKAQTERLELLTQRGEVQDAFIAKKKAARAQIALLRAKNEGLGALKERELRELQEAYRDINNEFKELGIMVDRDELLEGAAARRTGADDPGSMTNKELLGEAHRIQQDNTAKLQEALRTVEATKVVGAETAGTLQQNTEKIKNISLTLDATQAEMAVSRKLITTFLKRVYTDKVIIALVFLILAAVVAIIIYATLNPDQKAFNVPDVVKPPVPDNIPSPT